jgi:predicted lipoprotein with Yx(FWY)xxD motif
VEEGEMPVAGDGVTSELLNTFERGDGTIQVSYNGMPLYYYRNDILPGEIFGHEEEDSAGGWSVVGP